MFKFLKKLFFKQKNKISANLNSNSKSLTKEMVTSLKDGLKFLQEGNFETALVKFDLAIESGIHKEAYRERGYCLQSLGFHLDAIDDFSKAINNSPENANNYFGRSISKGILGYYTEALEDAKIAVSLSMVNSVWNNQVNQVAQSKGLQSVTNLYQEQVDTIINEMNETNPDFINIEKPIWRHK